MSLLHDISEEKAPTTEKEWDAAELAAWQFRFPKAKAKTTREFIAEFPAYKFRRQDDVVTLKLKESLIKELSVVNRPTQSDLKKSDATDAGSSDVIDKARAGADVSFSLMRNTINSSGNASGSDVANYIERAEELNDEVDTVPFGLETDDGQIVKVYVNAEQADKFEEAMKNMLGLEDDIEEAINRLSTEFDIVDVVWPKSEEGEEQDPDANLEIDDTSNLQLDDDPEDAADFADDNYDVVASMDDAAGEKKAKKDAEEDDDIAKAAADDEAVDDEDPDATPKKKKKKKKAQPAEPVGDDAPVKEARQHNNTKASIEESEQENKMTIGSKFLSRVLGEQVKLKAYKVTVPNGFTQKHLSAFVDGQDVATIENWEIKGGFAYLTPHFDDKYNADDQADLQAAMDAFVEDQGLDESLSLSEAAGAEDKDGVKDGFNIPLDSQARALVSKMKLPFAKRVVAFHVMSGVPGRYLNTEEVEGSIADAADLLRKKVSVRRAFMTLYEGLAGAKGFAIPQEAVKEGKDQYEIQTPDEQKVYGPASKTECEAKMDRLKKQEDADDIKGFKIVLVKSVNESTQKRGSFIQKLFETVLVELGLPQALITTGGPAAVGTGIFRTAELIEQDSNLERSLRLLATRLGIKQADAAAVSESSRYKWKLSGIQEAKAPKLPKDVNQPITVQGVRGMQSKPFEKTFKNTAAMEKWMDKNGEDITVSRYSISEATKFDFEGVMLEEVNVGTDAFALAVVSLFVALGIPDDVLARRRTQVVQALRAKKAGLRNRGQILSLMGRLQDVVSKNTVKPGGQPAEADVEEK